MKVNITRISGSWDEGYVLDKHTVHSSFLGEDENGMPRWHNERTEAGEAINQLKYEGNVQYLHPIVDALVDLVKSRFGSVDLIVPTPASRKRAEQPVEQIARKLAASLRCEYNPKVLLTVSYGASMKESSASKEERKRILRGRFLLGKESLESAVSSVLVVDDVYQTGATLETVCGLIRSLPGVKKVYVVAVTSCRSSGMARPESGISVATV